MAMQQCPNGHIYDDSKGPSCPYCNGENTIGRTIPLDMNMGGGADASAIPPTVMHEEPAMSKTEPVTIGTTQAYDNPEYQKTTYVTDVINEAGIDPIRGWLVCIEGDKKGLDFGIHSEKNRIGRGENVEVNLDFDTSVSKGTNAVLAYDNRNNKFFIAPGESKNNMYLNKNLLLSPMELNEYDVLEIGKTKMIFRSFCNDQFNWK